MRLHGCTELVSARNEYVYSPREDNRWDIPAEGCDLRSLARKWSIPCSTLAIVSGCEEWRELRQEYGRCFAADEVRETSRTATSVTLKLIGAEPGYEVMPVRAGDQASKEEASDAQWLPELDPEERRRRLIEILEVRIEEKPKAGEDELADCLLCRACA